MKSLVWGLEGQFAGLVFGVDEVGRGPLAGPVVAAAVCLRADSVPAGLADSKRLSARQRHKLIGQLPDQAIGMASVDEIERLNILGATHLAMQRAVAALAGRLGAPAMVLVDGNRLPELPYPARAIIGGDNKVAAIAAASIVAKQHRDAIMQQLDAECPGYGWAHNMGYPTAEHRRALVELGVSRHHRRHFAPVRCLLEAARD